MHAYRHPLYSVFAFRPCRRIGPFPLGDSSQPIVCGLERPLTEKKGRRKQGREAAYKRAMPEWLRLAARRNKGAPRAAGGDTRAGAPGSGGEIAMIRQDGASIRRQEQAQTTNASMVPSSHVGDISLADSETPLVRLDRMASSTSVSTSNKPGFETPVTEASSIRLEMYTPSTEQDNGSVKAVQDANAPGLAAPISLLDAKQSKPKGKRLKLFSRQPIATFTSSMATRPRRKRTDTDAASSQPAESSSVVSVKDVVGKASQSSTTAVDQELGWHVGAEGVLCRVYDTWALTSLGVANIGPVAGRQTLAVAGHIQG